MIERRLMISAVLVGLVVVAGTLVTADAQAQGRGRRIDGVRPEAHLNLGYRGTFGLGGRIDIPIVPKGLIDGVDDELAISPGLELFFGSYRGRYCYGSGRNRRCDGRGRGVSLMPTVALQWNFYINEDWSVFPELGIAMILFDDYYRNDPDIYIRPFVALGGRYHFNARNALLLRLGWPAGIQLGVTF